MVDSDHVGDVADTITSSSSVAGLTSDDNRPLVNALGIGTNYVAIVQRF